MNSASIAPVPADIRWMNGVATALFAGAGVLLLAALAWWGLRHPVFALAGIQVQGELTHNSASTLRATVAPRMTGNFFSLNLDTVRAAFEEVPWVRKAVVQREFPNRLRVTLHEHQVAAFWGAETETTLLSAEGDVFEANAGELEQQALPRLAGPQGQARQVLTVYRQLAPLFEPLDLSLEELTLTSRGGWQARLDTDAEIELGRGGADELVPRVRRFVQTLTPAAGRVGRRAESLLAADLRYGDGYALRLRGVTTTAGEAAKK